MSDESLTALVVAVERVGNRIDVLSKYVEAMGERVHRTNNLVQVLVTDSQLLQETVKALQETIVFLQRLIEVVEGRVDHLRGVVLSKSTPPPPMPAPEET